jgi:hypothetical protein
VRLSLKQYVDKTSATSRAALAQPRPAEGEPRHPAHGGQLRETYDGTLEALVSALDARPRDEGSSLRVAKYMMEITITSA